MLLGRLKSDSGLMGPTHALSAIALSLLIAWLASDFMFNKVLGSTDVIVFMSALIIITGASLMPDLDAVQSTSINTLGIVGVILSKGMRAVSAAIQSILRSKSDAASPDPHRGFWHTFISAGLIGVLITSLTSINKDVFEAFGKTFTVSMLIVTFIIYISLQLVMASLFKSFYKRSKGSFLSSLGLQIVSLISALALLISLPPELSYKWVGAAVSIGWILHLFGDMLTVAGVPVLFPLKFKGKRWWNFRFPFGIKAGGFIEKAILIPIFVIILIVSMINVIPMLG